MSRNRTEPDVCFGTDEQMLAWCQAEGLTPLRDEEGEYDWLAVYEAWLARQDSKEDEHE